MLLTREEKTQKIDQLTDDLANMKGIVFTEYRGMKMKDMQDLREKLHDKGIKYEVVKASLLKIALKNTSLEIPEELLDKPLALALSDEDEITPAKIIVEVGKEVEALQVIGGLVNRVFYSPAQIKNLAMLPGREELYAKVVGSMAAPLSGLVNVLQGNIRGLIVVLKQYSVQNN